MPAPSQPSPAPARSVLFVFSSPSLGAQESDVESLWEGVLCLEALLGPTSVGFFSEDALLETLVLSLL